MSLPHIFGSAQLSAILGTAHVSKLQDCWIPTKAAGEDDTIIIIKIIIIIIIVIIIIIIVIIVIIIIIIVMKWAFLSRN